MEYLNITEMTQRQVKFRKLYEPLWGPLKPELGHESLLWAYGEMGEVGDILIQEGDDAIMQKPEIRKHMIEEFCDVLMYLNDVLICCEISGEMVTAKYHERMDSGDNTRMLDMGEMLDYEKTVKREFELIPENGCRAALAAYNVMCRMNDHFKKMGVPQILSNPKVRDDFVDAFCDLLMRMNDILVCYRVSAEEVSKEFREKNDRNMTRWVSELPGYSE